MLLREEISRGHACIATSRISKQWGASLSLSLVTRRTWPGVILLLQPRLRGAVSIQLSDHTHYHDLGCDNPYGARGQQVQGRQQRTRTWAIIYRGEWGCPLKVPDCLHTILSKNILTSSQHIQHKFHLAAASSGCGWTQPWESHDVSSLNTAPRLLLAVLLNAVAFMISFIINCWFSIFFLFHTFISLMFSESDTNISRFQDNVGTNLCSKDSSLCSVH